jgi:peptide/nickel transport system permease protein
LTIRKVRYIVANMSLFTEPGAAITAAVDHALIPVVASPRRLALRRMVRSASFLTGAGLTVVMVVACLLAPVFAHHVARTGPDANHLTDTIAVDGVRKPVISPGGTTIVDGQVRIHPGGLPLAPQWLAANGRYVLGADTNGRDVAVRLLYGGRTSLLIAFAAATLCAVVAAALALVAGYRGGWLDAVVSRALDGMGAFPVTLLGVVLGTTLSVSGFHRFGLSIDSGSLLVPIFVIGYAMVPYVARPLRGTVISLKENEYVDAARSIGASPLRIVLGDLLPNIVSSLIVLYAITLATDIIFEAGLSFLGAGVQPPTASWGTLIADGRERIETAPWLTLAPGAAMALTTLGVMLVADALRDALDPRARSAGGL